MTDGASKKSCGHGHAGYEVRQPLLWNGGSFDRAVDAQLVLDVYTCDPKRTSGAIDRGPIDQLLEGFDPRRVAPESAAPTSWSPKTDPDVKRFPASWNLSTRVARSSSGRIAWHPPQRIETDRLPFTGTRAGRTCGAHANWSDPILQHGSAFIGNDMSSE